MNATSHSLTALYRPYNDLGRLLYVGIATDAEDRMDGHQRDHWFADIAAVEVSLYPDRRSAKTAETEAIRTEWPLWNIHESPLGCIAAVRKRQREGYWRQDKWGCWHRSEPVISERRDSWTAEDEKRFHEEFRHLCHVRRMTREASRAARYTLLLAAV